MERQVSEQKLAKKAKMLQLFNKYDANCDGWLSKNELRLILVSLGLKDEDSAVLFDHIDANNDGKIAYTEFVHWLYASSHSDKDTVGADVFHKTLDGPQTKEEAIDELMHKVQCMLANPPDGQKALKLKDVFKMLDTNASGKLSITEFVAGAKSLGLASDEDWLEDIFNQIDTHQAKTKYRKKYTQEQIDKITAAAVDNGIEPPIFVHGFPQGDISAFCQKEVVTYSGNDKSKKGKIVYDPYAVKKKDYQITYKEFRAAFKEVLASS